MTSRFDIVKTINSVLGDKELHLIDQGDDGVIRKSSFLGPNTRLNERLTGLEPGSIEFDSIITEPQNKLDSLALDHDMAYHAHKDVESRLEADLILLEGAREVVADPESTFVQRMNGRLVVLVMTGKRAIGFGIRDRERQTPESFTPQNVIVGLLGIAASIGVPALLALINKEHEESNFLN